MEAAIIIIFALMIYFLPAMTAGSRRHRNTAAITVLNLFLGWTALGWALALVWAFTDNVRPEEPDEDQTPAETFMYGRKYP